MTIESKENIALEKYISLVSDFTSKKITALDFEKQYLQFFKEEKCHFSSETFNILNMLFTDIDAFCADPKLIGKFDINEEQLRMQAELALKKLFELKPKK
jgi:hypothetical protein